MSAPGQAALDLATSDAVLRRVARGELPGSYRLYRPVATVALSRLDRLQDGFATAAAVAREHGFEPVLRSVGGRAAAYDGGSVVYEEIVPARLMHGLGERFDRVAGELQATLAALGADVRIGELPDEYCAGTHSLNLAGRAKVAGLAQRAIQGAAIVSAVVVVEGAERLRRVLTVVYAALGYRLDPDTVGALETAGLAVQEVERALRASIARGGRLAEASDDDATSALAADLVAAHRV